MDSSQSQSHNGINAKREQRGGGGGWGGAHTPLSEMFARDPKTHDNKKIIKKKNFYEINQNFKTK